MTTGERRARRRRLLDASRTHSRSINLRGHVRAIERILDLSGRR